MEKRNFTDLELLSFLEENGMATSYKNLKILKEGIANGTIVLEDDEEPNNEVPEENPKLEEKRKEVEAENREYKENEKTKNAQFLGEEKIPQEEVPQEEVEEEQPVEEVPEQVEGDQLPPEEVPQEQPAAPVSQVVMAPNGMVQAANNAGVAVVVDPSKVVQINIAEANTELIDRQIDNLEEKKRKSSEYIDKRIEYFRKKKKRQQISDMNAAKKAQQNQSSLTEEEVPEQVEADQLPPEEVPQEQPAPEQVPQEEIAPEAVQPRVVISMPVDGSLNISNVQGNELNVDPEGNLQAAIREAAEAFAKEKKFKGEDATIKGAGIDLPKGNVLLKKKEIKPIQKESFTNGYERFLRSYLTEDCDMSEKDYIALKEDVKTSSIKEILQTLLGGLEGKLEGIDTTQADRSRGDIRKLESLEDITKAVDKLERMLDYSENSKPEYHKAVSTIVNAIMNVNKYSAQFKEAYRNKKTVLIMKYQSIILSIISSISYILSVMVNYKGGNMTVVDNASIDQDFLPLKSLEKFNDSVRTGEFAKIVTDVQVVREYYLEVPTETMSTVLEAQDYLGMIVDGVKNLYSNLENNGKLVNIAYKAVGLVTLVLSIRDLVYSLSSMKTKITDMVNNIKTFANANETGKSLTTLDKFANTFKYDAEFGNDIANKDIKLEDRKISMDIRNADRDAGLTPKASEISPKLPELGSQEPVASQGNGLVFDF